MVNLNQKRPSLSSAFNRKSSSSSLLLPNTTLESSLMVQHHLATGSMGLYGYGENVDDFEAMCNELYWAVEQRLIMHKLARDYYGFRAFWIQSIPLLLLTTLTTIIGFIQYGQYSFGMLDETEYGAARQWLALTVGILGLISTFLTTLLVNTRHQSKHDMHTIAERTLSKVCQAIRFPERLPGDERNGRKNIAEHLNKQKAIFMTVSCTSIDIPPKILQAFRDLEHIMYTKPYPFRAIQYERFYDKLWKRFTNSRTFPWRIPTIAITNQTSLGKWIEEEYKMFTRGLKNVDREKSKNRIVMRRMSTGGGGGNVNYNRAPVDPDVDEENQRLQLLQGSTTSTASTQSSTDVAEIYHNIARGGRRDHSPEDERREQMRLLKGSSNSTACSLDIAVI